METLFQMFILLYNNKCSKQYFHVRKVKLLFGKYNYATENKQNIFISNVSIHKNTEFSLRLFLIFHLRQIHEINLQ